MLSDLTDAIKSFFPWVGTPTDRGRIEGNLRLTALTGSLLLPLLALIFLTGLFMDAFWHIHYAIGFVLIPVVALKLASTSYRAMRYYTGHPIYKAAGPPELVPRLLAPLLVLSVVTALATGVVLFVEHSRRGVFGTLHTDAAVASGVLLGIHILTYVPDVLGAVGRELHARLSRGASFRLAAVVAALVIGIILAAVTYRSGVWPARPRERELGTAPSSSAQRGATGHVASSSIHHEIVAPRRFVAASGTVP
jgi:hypothetical protein